MTFFKIGGLDPEEVEDFNPEKLMKLTFVKQAARHKVISQIDFNTVKQLVRQGASEFKSWDHYLFFVLLDMHSVELAASRKIQKSAAKLKLFML